jgi:nucleoid-associated protein YgaU
MVSMAIGGSGGLVDAAVGVGVGIASVATGGVPAMLRCLDPTALGVVIFNYNPKEIKVDRTANTNTQPNSKGGSSGHIVRKADLPTITLNEVTFTGDLTKMQIDTLQAWCAPPTGLITAIAGLFGVTSSVQPDVTFQWGPPMVGFMYTVKLKSVNATYTRFHTSGIPIRAKVNIVMNVQPSLLSSIPTNPTSGGLPGRSTHLVRQGESLATIAQQHYGRPGLWRNIAEINGIHDPSRVRPGTTVFLPGPAELPAGGR